MDKARSVFHVWSIMRLQIALQEKFQLILKLCHPLRASKSTFFLHFLCKMTLADVSFLKNSRFLVRKPRRFFNERPCHPPAQDGSTRPKHLARPGGSVDRSGCQASYGSISDKSRE